MNETYIHTYIHTYTHMPKRNRNLCPHKPCTKTFTEALLIIVSQRKLKIHQRFMAKHKVVDMSKRYYLAIRKTQAWCKYYNILPWKHYMTKKSPSQKTTEAHHRRPQGTWLWLKEMSILIDQWWGIKHIGTALTSNTWDPEFNPHHRKKKKKAEIKFCEIH